MSKKDILLLKGGRPNVDQTDSFHTWTNLRQTGHDNYFLEQYGDFIFSIIDGDVKIVSAVTGRDVASYDLVYIRGLGYEQVRNAIALYLDNRKKAFINDELKYRQYTSKLLQYIALADAGLTVPDTVYANLNYRMEALKYLGSQYPIVIKSTTGSNGADNFLVQSHDELQSIQINSECVMQKYIENQFDYRVVVAEDQVLIAYKRIRGSGGYLNNIAQGGSRELLTAVSPEMARNATLAAKTVGRNLTGVDILVDEKTGRHYVLEVNFNYGSPRFDGSATDDYFVKLANFLHKKASSGS